ncbi:MAG: HAD hydrolase family protein [Bacteroidales bacterium]|jgi:3-deoxy-D-manno-octulosonate 8-phosphate phosphatase (KDO 8-P phosphatase)|nr:HAD hydrolase family protein [Bacteroidales bacterium]
MNKKIKDFNFRDNLLNIKALIFDIDGVLSKSVIIIDEEGNPIRTTCVKDGYILKYAQKQGLKVAIISGAYNESVKKRFLYLDIPEEDIIVKSIRKIIDLEYFMNKYHLKYEEILYMGDDIPDYEILSKVGFPCCPADAVQEIKDVSIYISKLNGGYGCVREIIEQVLKTQNKWLKNNPYKP